MATYFLRKGLIKLDYSGVIAAAVTGVLALIGVIITNIASNKKVEKDNAVSQAVMRTEISNLTEEVRKHNNFAQQIPVIQEQIKVINHRIDDLEK